MMIDEKIDCFGDKELNVRGRYSETLGRDIPSSEHV